MTGSVAVDGDRLVGGCVTAVGSFDRRAIEAELGSPERGFARIDGTSRATDARAGDDRPPSESGTERFLAENGRYALDVGESVLRVGYGETAEDALAHVEAATECRSSTTARCGSLPALLSGDVVAYADLGPKTR